MSSLNSIPLAICPNLPSRTVAEEVSLGDYRFVQLATMLTLPIPSNVGTR